MVCIQTFLGGLLIPRTAAAYIVTVGFVLPGFGYLGEENWSFCFILCGINIDFWWSIYWGLSLLSTPCCSTTQQLQFRWNARSRHQQCWSSISSISLTVIHRQRASQRGLDVEGWRRGLNENLKVDVLPSSSSQLYCLLQGFQIGDNNVCSQLQECKTNNRWSTNSNLISIICCERHQPRWFQRMPEK